MTKLISRETSIFCEHGILKTSCRRCSPIERVGGVKIIFNDGLFFVDRGCRWKGQTVIHYRDECACRNLPEHYVQFGPRAVWTGELVAMPRGATTLPRIVGGKVLVEPKMLLRYMCRFCWPRERKFDTEDGARSHLENHHGVIPKNSIARAILDEVTALEMKG